MTLAKLDVVFDDVKKYIKCKMDESGYYGEGIQVVDLLSSTDDLMGFCRGNIIKYIARYGKKTNFKDTNDLYKAIHYIILMIMEEQKRADK